MNLNDLPPKGKFLILVLALVLITSILTFLTGGLSLTLIAAALIIIILFVSKPIWLPDDHGRFLIRKISLGIILALAGLTPIWTPLFNSLFPNITFIDNGPSTALFVFAFLVILVVNYFMRDKTVMKEHKTALDKEFPEKDFNKKLIHYSKVIENELNNIDIDTNWSDYNFTAIDCEVEIISNNSRHKKVKDFIKAIKSNNQAQVFLVLGDPGSGKSVALRKLTKDLLKEVKQTGKLPIYINLKEWQSPLPWTKENPPTPNELYQFIKKNLINRGDIFSAGFVETYFRKMYIHGRIFFLLDSFDEIPEVLDANQDSWIIDELSDVIYKFLAGSHDSRGILASRIFRKPTQKFKSKIQLEVRPFSEIKIEETFSRNNLGIDRNIFLELFKFRPELVSVVRNPFMITLMIEYLNTVHQGFPKSQADLYSNYILNRLALCKHLISSLNLTTELVMQFSINLSFTIFKSEKYGLEIKNNEIQKELPGFGKYNIDDFLKVLVYSKLGRLSRDGKFSFVHRRFNEYFVVQELINSPEEIDPENIPSDSRWRDALVLYCEVAEQDRVKVIATYCWSEFNKITSKDFESDKNQIIRSIHCLRFLTDSLRSRKEIIGFFSDDLGLHVIKIIKSNHDMLLKKYCIEAVGLLGDNQIETVIIEAFNTSNSWLYETAFKSSRHLSKLGKQSERNLLSYIGTFNSLELILKKRDLLFSASLSDAFTKIKTKIKLRILDSYLLLTGMLLLLILNPYITVGLLFVIIFEYYLKPETNSKILVGGFNSITFIKYIFRISPLLALFFSTAALKEESGIYLVPNLDIKPYLNIIGGILLFPLIDIYLFLRGYNLLSLRYYLALLKSNLTTTVVSVSVVIGISVLMYWVFNQGIGKIIISAFSIISLLLGFIFIGARTFHDIKKIKRFKVKILTNKNVTREYISAEFSSYKTPFIRLKFVKLLEDFSITPTGSWPTNRIPNKGNDYSSILLAKLEAKWSGFEK